MHECPRIHKWNNDAQNKTIEANMCWYMDAMNDIYLTRGRDRKTACRRLGPSRQWILKRYDLELKTPIIITGGRGNSVQGY